MAMPTGNGENPKYTDSERLMTKKAKSLSMDFQVCQPQKYRVPCHLNGEGRWEEWAYHFESVADVNGWDVVLKLKWLKVRLTGRAQIVFQRLM